MDYFDYESIAREAGIGRDRLGRIVETMKQEFPHDLMMCELHVLRACMAIRDGLITEDQALATSPTGHP